MTSKQRSEHRTGESHADGLRINGQHCSQCGSPCVNPATTRDQGSRRQSNCCSVSVCHGHVIVSRPWETRTHPKRTVWACCIGVADRHLGEPAWLRLA